MRHRPPVGVCHIGRLPEGEAAAKQLPPSEYRRERAATIKPLVTEGELQALNPQLIFSSCLLNGVG